MNIFNAHSDILYDVMIKRYSGQNNIIKKYHLSKLNQSQTKCIIMPIWDGNKDISTAPLKMLKVLGACAEELYEAEDFINIVYKKNDIEKIIENDKIAVILGMEGMRSLNGDISMINMLYRFGIRTASLTWNEENEFATGALGSIYRGLTQKGIEAVKRMESLGIVIDVSHSNEKTFYDIYNNTTKPFIASHSNCASLCNVGRNLSDEQIKLIAMRGGVIGINAYPKFIDKEAATVEKMADHIEYIINIAGINHVGLGFDFCDFIDEYKNIGTLGIEECSKSQNILIALKNRGYKIHEIEKIAYLNFENIFNTLL